MSRKVYVNVTCRLIIRANDGVEINDVLSEMDYNFTADKDIGADIEDAEILDWEIKDSK